MMTRARAAGVFSAIFLSSSALSDDGSGLKISAAVDSAGAFRLGKDDRATDRFDIREAELILVAPVDQTFDGVLSAAAHREAGVSVFEVHEAYLGSSKLIPRSQIRLGQFFLGVGRLNRFHRHEWPFIFAPKVQQEFFGAEGALDSGLEYSFLTPLPFFLEVSAGVTNGWTYGHAHDEGEKPRKPTHYGRAVTYASLPGSGGAQLGMNYMSRIAASGDRMTLGGLDLAAKWRHGGVLDLLLQGEVWQRTKTPRNGAVERSLGAYFFPQSALTSQFQFGILLDYYTVLTLKDLAGAKVSNSEQHVVPTLTYRASEFSTLRLAYDSSVAKQTAQADMKNQIAEVQATFMIGAHPAHDF